MHKEEGVFNHHKRVKLKRMDSGSTFKLVTYDYTSKGKWYTFRLT